MEGKVNGARDVTRITPRATPNGVEATQAKRIPASIASAVPAEGEFADDAVAFAADDSQVEQVLRGVDRAVSRTDSSRGEALRRLSEIAARRERSAAAEPADSQSTDSTDSSSGVFRGSYRDGVAVFQSVALTVKDNGDVDATMFRPDGIELKGRGAVADDGTLRLSFEDGNSYEANLQVNGSSAQLRDVRNTGFRAPTPSVENRAGATDQDAEGPSYNGVYKDGLVGFDGVLLELGDDGAVDAKLFLQNGEEVSGKGNLDSDGKLTVTFEDGNSYEAKLTIDGNLARLSKLRFLGGA